MGSLRSDLRTGLRLRLLIVIAGTLVARPVVAQPGAPYEPQEPPQASTPVARVTFVSTTEKRWDVRLGDDAVCTTPCAIPVDPLHFVTMYSHDVRPTRLRVGHLPPGDLVVTARPRATGAFATGVTFTSLGGAALVTGITLIAVGCSTDRDGMCTAGMITGLAGAAVTAASIQLIRSSLPRVQVGRATPYVATGHVGVAGAF
jgi:hypothetical protein